ncbi:hypothetical protein [Thiofilum flexile]|uniref:hypothetical protein n=1 Tax=Thiofilum flexile TaxID=125627 RepID=UPI0003A3E122|nr:hypothetical protein [Thiofilum flexile]
MYGPSDIEKYDIKAGTVTKLYDSPYHGDYEMCGNLWFSEDGRRIFTACGNVFRASDIQSQDMTYNGSLTGLPRVQNVMHSALINKVAAIPAYRQYVTKEDVDTEVYLYDYEFLMPSDILKLPYFVVGDKGYAGHGRFVFFNNAADTLTVLLKADSNSGMLNDQALFNITLAK